MISNINVTITTCGYPPRLTQLMIVVQIGKYVSSESMVQLKQKGVYGVEIPPQRSFLDGLIAL